jgi:GGDEF domain-containing protein
MAFRAPFTVDGVSIFARLSIGAALAPSDGATRMLLLRNVDAALYQAKAAGRDRVAVFNAIDS